MDEINLIRRHRRPLPTQQASRPYLSSSRPVNRSKEGTSRPTPPPPRTELRPLYSNRSSSIPSKTPELRSYLYLDLDRASIQFLGLVVGRVSEQEQGLSMTTTTTRTNPSVQSTRLSAICLFVCLLLIQGASPAIDRRNERVKGEAWYRNRIYNFDLEQIIPPKN